MDQGADAAAQALLAPAPYAVMLAYARSATFLALALAALVGAYARPQALLALAPAAVMLAYLRSPAFLALALAALVGADARPQALLAPAPAAVMLAYARAPTFLAIAFFTVMPASFARHGGSCWRTLLAALASFELALIGPCRVVWCWWTVDVAGPGNPDLSLVFGFGVHE